MHVLFFIFDLTNFDRVIALLDLEFPSRNIFSVISPFFFFFFFFFFLIPLNFEDVHASHDFILPFSMVFYHFCTLRRHGFHFDLDIDPVLHSFEPKP